MWTHSSGVGLRAEWAKAYARAEHWKEEQCLLQEEMQHALQYASYQRRWWQDQCERRKEVPDCLADGLRGYALKQAHLWKLLGEKFAGLWHKIVRNEGLGIKDWPRAVLPVQSVGEILSLPLQVPPFNFADLPLSPERGNGQGRNREIDFDDL